MTSGHIIDWAILAAPYEYKYAWPNMNMSFDEGNIPFYRKDSLVEQPPATVIKNKLHVRLTAHYEM